MVLVICGKSSHIPVCPLQKHHEALGDFTGGTLAPDQTERATQADLYPGKPHME
ncbi:hypothetical protein DPMN_100051 [Dreissena polymorpha]|uniref:Uncharacterized protein n=1 Tax=Dreissena polymorpha TaxID=45954 RepID=A0A9D4R735_DREPO|nr:hypothetical protein DPMN_100051 [Dreissena polymorpha]